MPRGLTFRVDNFLFNLRFAVNQAEESLKSATEICIIFGHLIPTVSYSLYVYFFLNLCSYRASYVLCMYAMFLILHQRFNLQAP